MKVICSFMITFALIVSLSGFYGCKEKPDEESFMPPVTQEEVQETEPSAQPPTEKELDTTESELGEQ